MREILFKAKRIDNGEWVEGGFCQSTNGRTFLIGVSQHGYIDGLEVIPKTVCQHTGLVDKNGNKIWENDVVKRYNSNGDEWRISKIVWADHSLNMGWCIEDIKSLTKYSDKLFRVGFDVNDTEKCEVIGNIFDNADLLKGAEIDE